jgi:hypothetical protein
MPHAYLRSSPVSAGAAFFCSKVVYVNRQHARRTLARMHNTADRLVAKGCMNLHAYVCNACGCWHIGGDARRSN